jgi:hypothetical protein
VTTDLFARYAELDPAMEESQSLDWDGVNAALLVTTDGRTARMTIEEKSETGTKEQDQKRKGWVAAIAFAAVVVVVGGAILLNAQTEGLDPASTPMEPPTNDEALGIMASYFDAYDAGDVEAVLALFEPDATLASSGDAMTIDDLEQYLTWNLAQATVQTPMECTVQETEDQDTINVTCAFTHLPASAAAVDGPAVPHNVYTVVSSEGIRSFESHFYQPNFRTVDVHFFEWMNETHPEDRFRLDFGIWDSIDEAEQLGLLRAGYVIEWAAYLDANGCEYDDARC